MAATVNSNASAALSPRASAGESIGVPHAPPRRTSPPPPWTQIVGGKEVGGVSDPPAPPETLVKAVAEFTNQGFLGDSDGCENVNGSPKQAWNRSYNAALESGLVMGAVAWPTLSESASVSVKPPLADSSTNLPDAPISVPQVIAANESSSPASPQKSTTPKPNKPILNATQNYGRHARQKPTRREGGGISSSDGGFSQSSSMADPSHANNSVPKTISSSGGSDSSVRDHGHNNAIREGAPRSGGDRPQQRNYRRSNSGSYLRGEGFNGRRDHDRRNHDWNHQRSFNGRDQIMQPQRAGPGGFMRAPPPSAATYFPPPPIPYGGLMGIPSDVQPFYYYGPQAGMPVVAQMPPALYYPQRDSQLHAKIINQIDYYFSNENLIKDTYLRKNMDEYGWVAIQLIANFKKVVELTTDIQLILDALRASTVVEVQGDKIRKRDDWMRWVMPSAAQYPTASGSQYPRMLQDILPARVQGLTLEDKQD
ncbi:hypothetical protein V2J09_002053 [Rumex salicifolius]